VGGGTCPALPGVQARDVPRRGRCRSDRQPVSTSIATSAQQIGARFNLVGAIPVTTLAVFVGALVISGAPEHAPSAHIASERLASLKAVDYAVAVFAIIALALILNPFQVALVKFLEGYWPATRLLSHVSDHLRARHVARRDQLLEARSGLPRNEPFRSWFRMPRDRARELLREFPDRDRIMPTRLGNALRRAEDFAGDRYGLDAVGVIPRLYALMPAQMVAIVDDARNAMDVMASFVFVWLVATAASFALLLHHGPWLLVPIVTFGLAWLSYLGCISAARAYGQTLAWAMDLYRFTLYEQLRLELPSTHDEELAQNKNLTAFLQGRWMQYPDKRPKWNLAYRHPELFNVRPESPSEGNGPIAPEDSNA
jgi:hypothetical protein